MVIVGYLIMCLQNMHIVSNFGNLEMKRVNHGRMKKGILVLCSVLCSVFYLTTLKMVTQDGQFSPRRNKCATFQKTVRDNGFSVSGKRTNFLNMVRNLQGVAERGKFDVSSL